MWRSMVAYKSGGLGVAGSNPVIPTILYFCIGLQSCKIAISFSELYIFEYNSLKLDRIARKTAHILKFNNYDQLYQS